MNIDLFVGGMLESYGNPGPLFAKIIREQFQRLRDADRFWFENKENGLFNDPEIKALRKLKLSEILIKVTNISRGDIQENVFQFKVKLHRGLRTKEIKGCDVKHFVGVILDIALKKLAFL